jgi:hypothetical protein
VAISWGDEEGRFSVGIDIDVTSESSTSITIRVRRYARTSWNSVNDTETYNWSGSGGSGHKTFNMTQPNNTPVLVQTNSYSATKDYDGGPTWTFYVSLSGVFNGATPTHHRSYTVPARDPNEPGAPSQAAVSNIRSDAVFLSWTKPASNGSTINKFQSQVDNSSSFSSPVYDQVDDWATSDWAVGLTRHTNYWSRVRAHNGVGWGNWSNVRSFTTLAVKPDAPGTPSISSITSTGGTLSWSAPSDNGGDAIDNYVLHVDTSSSFSSPDVYTLSGTSKTISNMSSSDDVYARVAAVNGKGQSPWSGTRHWVTSAVAPSAPDAPDLLGTTSTTATIDWDPPSDDGGSPITSYTVQWSTTSGFTSGNGSATATAPYTISGLSPGTRYYIRVRANSAVGSGAWSPSVPTTLQSGVKVWNGTAFVDRQVYVWDGSSWTAADEVRIWNGSTWVLPSA